MRISVRAVPGQTCRGKVARIAPLPDAQTMWMSPDLKVYATEIHIEGSTPGLRPDMSWQPEIIVEEFEEVTYIPVQAVVRVADRATAYVRLGDVFEPPPAT